MPDPGYDLSTPFPRVPVCIRLRLLVSLALLPVLAVAQGPPKPGILSAAELKLLSVEDLLQQEVISVSRRPEALGRVAGSVFYISGNANRLTGSTRLPEVLRLAPSLFVAQASASQWGVNARGFLRTNAASNKLLVLIDGRTAYLPLYSNVFWDTTDVFLPDLDSIEIISGPAGSNWGSNAVNGVINIRSKSAQDTIGGLLKISGGTDGSQVAVRQGFRLGETGAMRVYAKHTKREPTYSPTGADDGHDSWQATQGGFRADWSNPRKGGLMVQGEWNEGVYHARPLAPVRNDAGHLLVRWERDLSPDSSVWVRGFYDYVLRGTNGNLTEETRTTDLEFQHSLSLGDRHQFLWGLTYRRIYDGARDHSAGFVILPRDIWLDLGAVFVQHDIAWRDDALRLTSGLRYEHNDFTGWEYQPSLRLAWNGRKHTAWVGASRAIRTPSRIEKGFFAPAEPPYFIAGGPDFVSEVIHSYELGLRGRLGSDATFTATAYYHKYDNLRSVESGPPIVQANGVEGESYGLELFMDYEVTPAWRLRAGGFIMRQKTWNKPWSRNLEGGLGEGSFPDHQAYLRSTFQLSSKVHLWLGLRHVAEVPAYENGNGVVPAYTELDARVGWKVRPDLEFSLVGRNLLNDAHPEIGGLDSRREIRRSVSATLRWEF